MSSNTSKKKDRTYNDILAFILEQGTSVCLSRRTISKETGYSLTTVTRAIAYLQEKRLLAVHKSTAKAIPDTLVYIGPKQIRRSVTEVINGAFTVLNNLMSDVVRRYTNIKYVDVEIPKKINPAKVLLHKALPEVNASMIIYKNSK